MTPPDDPPGHRSLHDVYGDEIRERAAQLRRQYPNCDVEFIVNSLEYDLGMRAATIRRALAAADPS